MQLSASFENMAVREMLLLGNPALYKVSEPVSNEEVSSLRKTIDDLHDTMIDFRERYGAGRAIAAPQIGVFKRLIYMHIDRPVVFINPELTDKSKEMIEVLDDCMCFPDLLVKVLRHKRCVFKYKDEEWNMCSMNLEDDLSELLQHEYDHLNGILAVERAIDGHSFTLRSERHFLE